MITGHQYLKGMGSKEERKEVYELYECFVRVEYERLRKDWRFEPNNVLEIALRVVEEHQKNKKFKEALRIVDINYGKGVNYGTL